MISASLGSAKLPKKGREIGSDGWVRYYAGYSANFVERVLEPYVGEQGTILDPWNGSGTTTAVAGALGLKSIGFDISPYATCVASAKAVDRLTAQKLVELSAGIRLQSFSDDCFDVKHDRLSVWINSSEVRGIRSFQKSIHDCFHGFDESARSLGDLALMLSLKKILSIRRSSNPTWVKPESAVRVDIISLRDCFLSQLKRMVEELESAVGVFLAPVRPLLATADARRLPLNDASVSVVLTSPPYCTRLDYAVQYDFELSFLKGGMSEYEFKNFRRSLMGGLLVRQRRLPKISSSWPNDVKLLLENIKDHPSADSGSYYFKTYHQYFHDAMASLLEIKRVLVDSGEARIVVQTSFYKEIVVCLPSLYASMASHIGMNAVVEEVHPVSRTVSQIHSNNLTRARGSSHKECVVYLTKATL